MIIFIYIIDRINKFIDNNDNIYYHYKKWNYGESVKGNWIRLDIVHTCQNNHYHKRRLSIRRVFTLAQNVIGPQM